MTHGFADQASHLMSWEDLSVGLIKIHADSIFITVKVIYIFQRHETHNCSRLTEIQSSNGVLFDKVCLSFTHFVMIL